LRLFRDLADAVNRHYLNTPLVPGGDKFRNRKFDEIASSVILTVANCGYVNLMSSWESSHAVKKLGVYYFRDIIVSNVMEGIWFAVSYVVPYVQEGYNTGYISIAVHDLTSAVAYVLRDLYALRPTSGDVEGTAKVLLEWTVDVLESVSEYFRRANKSPLVAFCRAARTYLGQVRRSVVTAFKQTSQYLRQFRVARELIETFVEYQSWLEEIHFSQTVEDAIGDVRG
jgi:hypothetical protein